LRDELLLLVGVGLEQEGTDLVEGTTEAFEQLAHAAGGEPSTERRLDPVAHLAGRPEASRGDFLLESIALSRGQSAGITFVLQGVERSGCEGVRPSPGGGAFRASSAPDYPE
jgi:hypothetical protein